VVFRHGDWTQFRAKLSGAKGRDAPVPVNSEVIRKLNNGRAERFWESREAFTMFAVKRAGFDYLG